MNIDRKDHKVIPTNYMTQDEIVNTDEILRMAREAGLEQVANLKSDFVIAELERFAALIAEATKEKAAKVCELRYMGDNNREDMEAKACAAAIRSMK